MRVMGIGASDADYEAAGAKIMPDAKSVFDGATMIVKVKEPQPSEWVQLREDHILFTYLHLAADAAQTKGLMESGCTAIAYETITDASGGCRYWRLCQKSLVVCQSLRGQPI